MCRPIHMQHAQQHDFLCTMTSISDMPQSIIAKILLFAGDEPGASSVREFFAKLFNVSAERLLRCHVKLKTQELEDLNNTVIRKIKAKQVVVEDDTSTFTHCVRYFGLVRKSDGVLHLDCLEDKIMQKVYHLLTAIPTVYWAASFVDGYEREVTENGFYRRHRCLKLLKCASLTTVELATNDGENPDNLGYFLLAEDDTFTSFALLYTGNDRSYQEVLKDEHLLDWENHVTEDNIVWKQYNDESDYLLNTLSTSAKIELLIRLQIAVRFVNKYNFKGNLSELFPEYFAPENQYVCLYVRVDNILK